MPTDNTDTMQGDTGNSMDDQEPDSPEQGEDEATSVFLPKSAFGGKMPKVGDSLSDFKVVDIDSQTGDVEAKCNYDNKSEDSKGSMMDQFDSAVPADEGQ